MWLLFALPSLAAVFVTRCEGELTSRVTERRAARRPRLSGEADGAAVVGGGGYRDVTAAFCLSTFEALLNPVNGLFLLLPGA